MEKLVVSYEGSVHRLDCIGCTHKDALGIEGLEVVYSDEYFGLYQDFETPIPGFYVVEARRHIKSALDFNGQERERYFPFALRAREGMKEVLGIDEVTFIQEERSGHFHLWLFPHYEWMSSLKKPSVENIRSLMDYAIEYRDATEYAQKNMRNEDIYQQILGANKKMREYFKTKSVVE